MDVRQVIAQARSGELSNLSEEAFSDTTIINYINLAVIELYKRFTITTHEAIVTMKSGKTRYMMNSKDSSVDMGRKRLLYILSAYDQSGEEIVINTVNDGGISVMTPSYNTVQIPVPVDGERIGVSFVAEPELCSHIDDEVEVPLTMLEALLHYIGYRAHGAVNGNVEAENNTHYQRFEASCKRITTSGLTNCDTYIAPSITAKGFI
jgi:hypothetical protein